jgi:hypothetical protein
MSRALGKHHSSESRQISYDRAGGFDNTTLLPLIDHGMHHLWRPLLAHQVHAHAVFCHEMLLAVVSTLLPVSLWLCTQ